MSEVLLPIVTADIPETRMQRLGERIAQINERARKRGMGELVLRSGEHTLVSVAVARKTFHGGRWIAHAEIIKVNGYKVVIEGQAPRIPGWKMAGHVNIKKAYVDAETGRVKAMPATAFLGYAPDEIREALVTRLDARGRIPCDHCRMVRNRKEAFVLERDDASRGRFVVGSECFADFSGHDPAAIIRAYSGLPSIQQDVAREIALYAVEERYDWESFRAAERVSRVSFADFLAAAYQSASQTGFNPEGSVNPTSSAALAFLRSGNELSERAHAAAASVLRWLPSMGFRQDDLWKARRFGEEIGFDDIDLAARCVLAWCQVTGTPLSGSHLGAPGNRIDVELRVVGSSRSRRSFTDAQGREHPSEVRRWRFMTDSGAVATWQTSAEVDIGIDDVIACRATVKAHAVSATGVAVTEFSRVSGVRVRQDPDVGSHDAEIEASPGPRSGIR